MTTGDDRSWDVEVSDGGAFDRKFREWRRRDWTSWLTDELRFPFEVTRTEDMEANPCDPPRGPMAVRRRLRAVGLAEDHRKFGILVMVVPVRSVATSRWRLSR